MRNFSGINEVDQISPLYTATVAKGKMQIRGYPAVSDSAAYIPSNTGFTGRDF